MNQIVRTLFGGGALLLATATCASAQHAGDMLIGSAADGAGALVADFNFNTIIRVAYDQDVGPFSLYTAEEPGFDLVTVDEPGEVYALDPGVEISMEVTAIDAGKLAVVVDAVTLGAVGDVAPLGITPTLHEHPIFRIQLLQPAGQFGDARVSFKLTSTTPGFSESEIYTMRVSNGHLAPPDYGTGPAVDKASLACQTQIGKQTKKLIGKVYGLLDKCAAKVAAVHATEAAGLPTASAQDAADKACGDGGGAISPTSTMLGKINGAVASAAGAIVGKCAVSGDYDANAINQNLGLAVCHVQDMIAAAYHEINESLEGITDGGAPVVDSLPCLAPTQEAD